MAQQVTDGGRKPRVTDQEILDVFREHQDPVLSTAEVADLLPIKRRGTLNRLRRLEEEEGAVVSKQIGGRNTVWWLTSEPRAPSTPERDDIAPSSLSHGHEPPDEPGDHPPKSTEETTSTAEGYEPGEVPSTRIGDSAPSFVDAPQHVDRAEALEAVDAIREYLRENGPTSMRELVLEVMPEHSLGYDVPDLDPGDRYRGAWWRRVIRPSLEAVDDVEYRDSHSDYQFVGEEVR